MSITNTKLQDTNNDKIKIIVTDARELSEYELMQVEENLVEISKGKNTSYPANVIATKLLEFLNKATVDTRNGAIAEFLQTMIIRDHGFEQNHCYMNLEEGSIKKGFDGLFEKEDLIWILESKSSHSVKAHDNKHKTTIDRAYTGLRKMLNGNTTNDPWENAASHAQKASSSNNLVERLEKLSIEYMSNNFSEVRDNNIMLGSTIISENINKVERDVTDIQKYLKEHDAKSEIVIALNLSTIDMFMETLEKIANG